MFIDVPFKYMNANWNITFKEEKSQTVAIPSNRATAK